MTVGFLGTGLMGAPMARRLARAGHTVTVWNRSRAKADPLATDGVRVAETAAAAIAQARIVVTMLFDGAATEALFTAEGLAGHLAPGALWIDMASATPAHARRFAGWATGQGAGFLDAPVSGGVIGAEDGTLSIMAGGAPTDFDRARPVLSAMGRPTHVGPVGTGQLAKLANQLICGGTIGLVAEALVLAKAGGADPAKVRQALAGGFADSRVLEVHGARMLERAFAPGGTCTVHLKDMRGVAAEAADQGLTLPLMAQVLAGFDQVVADGDGGLDQSALLRWTERLNGRRLDGAVTPPGPANGPDR